MFKIRFKTIRFFFLSFFIIVLQSTLADSFAVLSVKPDLILLLVLFYALYHGPKAGISYGICTGLAVDALSGGVMGMNSFALGCVGCACGLLKERVYINHFLTKFLVAFGAGILNVIVYYCLALQFFKLPAAVSNVYMIFWVITYSSLFNIFFVEILDRAVIERSTSLL